MLSAAELAPVHYGSRRSVWAFVLHVGRSAATCSSQRGCTGEGRASPPPLSPFMVFLITENSFGDWDHPRRSLPVPFLLSKRLRSRVIHRI